MNVLFLSQIVPYPPHGGVLQRGYHLLKEISRYHTIHLVAFVHPEILSTEAQIKESMAHLRLFCRSVHYVELWPKKSKFHKYLAFLVGYIYPYPFSTLAHYSCSCRHLMKKTLQENDIDLVHFDTIGLAFYRDLVGSIPSVVTHHNIESNLMARRANREQSFLNRHYVRLQSDRLKRFEREKSPYFDMNIMMSENDLVQLREMAPTVKGTIVPNGVDITYFTPRDDPQENAIIYTGGMNMFANKDAVMHLIQDIWPRLKSRIADLTFYVIGQDPPRELLEKAKQDPGIVVLGYVDDIRPYVARSAVYVVPIRVGGGTRLKVLDALAQGKAIVSTSVGCEGIAVTDRKNIHIEDDDSAFADRVIELMADKSRRDELGREARKLAETAYSWESVGKLLQQSYDLVAKR